MEKNKREKIRQVMSTMVCLSGGSYQNQNIDNQEENNFEQNALDIESDFEKTTKEIEELLKDDEYSFDKDYIIDSSAEHKKLIQNLLECEISDYQQQMKSEELEQKRWVKEMNKTRTHCKLNKVRDFLDGLMVGEVVGTAFISGVTDSTLSGLSAISSEVLFGTTAGVLFGYGLYLKNKNLHEQKQNKDAQYAKKQIESSRERNNDLKKYINRCKTELNELDH